MEELNLAEVKPDIKKILLIGPEGSGKTHFIGTMPKPIYLFSFDKGYHTLAGKPGITVGLCMDENRYVPHAYADFKQRFDQLKKGLKYKWPDGKEEPYCTIALDSLSFLSTPKKRPKKRFDFVIPHTPVLPLISLDSCFRRNDRICKSISYTEHYLLNCCKLNSAFAFNNTLVYNTNPYMVSSIR